MLLEVRIRRVLAEAKPAHCSRRHHATRTEAVQGVDLWRGEGGVGGEAGEEGARGVEGGVGLRVKARDLMGRRASNFKQQKRLYNNHTRGASDWY